MAADRTKNRSDRYQYVLVECPCSPEMLTDVFDSSGAESNLNPWKYDEEILELKDRLKSAFWRIVDTKLTVRQKEVIHLYAEGFTQTEIAKKLNVNQSSITKSINGNCDYRNGKVIYGGAKSKLKKIISQDEEVQEILLKISELQDSEY